jgi:heme ABC exporter ATP-binding subunit CcmA
VDVRTQAREGEAGTAWNATPILRADGVTKAFGPRWALRGVSLSVRPGEIVALMGPNGAGKSTLFRVLATLLRPTAGVVYVEDRRWPPDGAGVRPQVTLLTHQPWLYLDLTAAENLRFAQRLYGWPEDPEALRAALEWMGLADRAGDPVRTFSRGMLQRLALARVLLSPAPVLLLDEPFTGLDVVGMDRAQEALRTLADQGRAILIALHDPTAASPAHRVVVLAGGRCVAEGAPQDLPAEALREIYKSALRPLGGRQALHPPSKRAAASHRMIEVWPEGSARTPQRASPGAPTGGRRELRVLRALLEKDLRVEGRAREALTPTLTLAGLSLFLFGAAFELRPDLARAVVPAFLWMLLLFASSLGVGRMMAAEMDRGTWEGLLMAPADRSALFAGKALVHGLLLILLIGLSLMAAAVFFNLSLWEPRVLLLLGLGAAGLAGVATLLAAMAMAARARELLLPILLFPVAAPLLIAGIQGTRAVLEGNPDGWGTWAQMMLAYDIILLTVGGLIFEEAAGL